MLPLAAAVIDDDDAVVEREKSIIREESCYLMVWTSTTSASRGAEANERRLLHLLGAKKKRYEVVYVDLVGRGSLDASLDLPLLTVGGTPYTIESLQDLEDNGRLDRLFSPAPSGGPFSRRFQEIPIVSNGTVDREKDNVEGYLEKKSKLKSGKQVWTKRFFQLEKSTKKLLCYADHEKHKVLATMDLADVDSVSRVEDSILALKIKNATFKFKAPTSHLCRLWEEAITATTTTV